MKDFRGDEERKERFREKVLRVLVDQGLVSAKKLFHNSGDDRGRIIPGILRHCHPLGKKDNSAIVVAFLVPWFVAHINQKLTAGKKLKNGIRVTPHLPPIIDALRNEALRARRALLQADPRWVELTI